MKNFTEIGQYRNAIREIKSHYDYQGKDANGDAIYSHTQPYPVLKFRGTVKLHGTNSAIALYKNELDFKYEFQSRENVLSLEKDNAGFMNYMWGTDYYKLFENIEFSESCVIYGEWCGGNIQKSVAINGLHKMFVIFAVRIDDVYQDMENFKHLKNEEQRIYNILQFPTFEIIIDINSPELVQNKLIELTNEVEKECPVAKYFGIENGTGEGLVWTYDNGKEVYRFKVKGELHSISKVRTLAAVDIDKVNSINELVSNIVSNHLPNIGSSKKYFICLLPS